MNFNLGEVARACAGTLHRGNETTVAGRICTDTRKLQRGETFLALRGPRFNGDEFIATALKSGAAGVISQDPMPKKFPKDCYFLQVKDTTEALGAIAHAWRNVVNPKVIAVSGSSGKTTTKEMLAHICRNEVPTLATEGNLNNLIGLPLTMLRLQPEHEVAIIELGMSVPGELAQLTRLCNPDVVIVTNIGNAHIGNFGSMDNLIAGEAEVLEAMRPDGTAILNADCLQVRSLHEKFTLPANLRYYGQDDKMSVRAVNIEAVPPYGYEFDLIVNGVVTETRLNLFGRFQIYNALAASAAAAAVGIDVETIGLRLAEFDPPRMRAQTEWFDGIFIISDCYNASPDAMIKSLASVRDVSGVYRRVALLGDMLELGVYTEDFHRQVGSAAANAGLDFLCTVGELSRTAHEEAIARGLEGIHFSTAEEAAGFLSGFLETNDALIVKGSRGVRMEDVLLKLKEIRTEIRDGAASREMVRG